ncbi:MAG: family transcriptional regulator, nitrogen fixation regulation protein [Acetobacteraceae bacterium]|jgi:CRP/FNR family nitrogen fixation transcriptional regulator|nr:family transcriptional regulator, nitrogen fixation regulation protein [Acetobacteraceae bacterium]
MSVSISVAAKHGQAAPQVAFAAMPWALPAEPDTRDGLDLSGVVMHFGPDRPIYAEGDEARCFYKVVSGVVRTCRFLSDGRRQIDAFHMTGEVFGFEAGSDHRMSAEAVSDCTVVAYRRRGLETMIARDDRLGRWFFAHAMNCLELAREHSLLLGRGSAAQKISAFLLEASSREGSDGVIDLAMSRQDIADYLGLTIETVSRTLSQLERDGTIKLPTARRVVLKDRRALKMLNS